MFALNRTNGSFYEKKGITYPTPHAVVGWDSGRFGRILWNLGGYGTMYINS